ncbi:MAG: hypothetical protein Q8L88_13650 [Bacteroidota bacterium]|nr:hypothetical protein [Bacteroidota bacterium]
MQRLINFFLPLILITLGVAPLYGQSLSKIADDDGTKYTNVGNLGVTITNFGTIGNGFTTWPNQPSLEYPKGSGIEHLFLGGLWIGGIPRKEGVVHVSTAAVDIGSVRRQAEGFEMTSDIGKGITLRSTLTESPYFDLNAISHQDMVMDFTDRNTRIPDTGDSIPNHIPLGVDIHLESYAWNFPFADFFVILSYTIKNASVDTIDGLYVGLWNNAVVRNTKLTGRPGGRDFYNHSAKGFIDSLRLGYTFDFDGAPYGPPANSYYGYKLLGTNPFPLKDSVIDLNKTYYYSDKKLDSLGDLYKNTYYNGWKFNNRSGSEVYFFPDQEFLDNSFRGKYQRLSRKMPKPNIEALGRPSNVLSSDGITTGEAPASMTDLLSVGPFKSFPPGDSVQVVFALVCAKKLGSFAPSEDYKNPKLRVQLYSNSGWAQQAYNGEDLNGNNALDVGEDINGDGKLNRFTLPQPPRQPRVRTLVENQRVTIFWDKVQAEQSFDPISRNYDFEGYRIYRSSPGADVSSPENFLLSMQLVGEFDRSDDNIGYNTGLQKIKLDAPKKFDGDTVEYWYQFPPKDDPITSLNGWQYLYGVSAFDAGDSANGLTSLECAKVIKRVVPGMKVSANGSSEIGVYPNPYYSNASWDGTGERTRKIYFTNLSAHAEIKIYTMTGDLVAELLHDSQTYDGSGIKWFDDFKTLGVSPEFAGGEHAWDLISKYDQAIATGLYLFTVKNLDTGDLKRGKFVIVK